MGKIKYQAGDGTLFDEELDYLRYESVQVVYAVIENFMGGNSIYGIFKDEDTASEIVKDNSGLAYSSFCIRRFRLDTGEQL